MHQFSTILPPSHLHQSQSRMKIRLCVGSIPMKELTCIPVICGHPVRNAYSPSPALPLEPTPLMPSF